MTEDRNRWVAIEQDFCDHPKILQVGAAGGWIHLRAILYAARHRTNGFVPDRAVWDIFHSDTLIDEAGIGEADMCQAKLWHRVANGYQIHDYLKYQTNAETIREKRARAGRLGGLARAKQMSQKAKHSKLEVEVEVEKDFGSATEANHRATSACLCGLSFKSERALALHLQNVHGGPPVSLSPDEARA